MILVLDLAVFFWDLIFFWMSIHTLRVCIRKKLTLASSGLTKWIHIIFLMADPRQKKTNSKSCSKIIQFGTCKQFSDDIDLIDNLQKHSLALWKRFNQMQFCLFCNQLKNKPVFKTKFGKIFFFAKKTRQMGISAFTDLTTSQVYN